ncbi:hypothetical protein Nmel_007969 [Mimus melanotis]
MGTACVSPYRFCFLQLHCSVFLSLACHFGTFWKAGGVRATYTLRGRTHTNRIPFIPCPLDSLTQPLFHAVP